MFLCALITLPVIGFVHELITFGYGWGFLTGERDRYLLNGYLTIPSMIAFQLFGGVLDGIVLALVTLVFYRTPLCHWMLGIGFVCLYGLGGNSTARITKSNLGQRGVFPEAFMELMFHPVLTPALCLAGGGAFLWLTRRVWQIDWRAKP